MKLFRAFRQSFIKESQFRKYALYAIGEILLVMIGILLAFQINNWKDNRSKQEAELGLCQNIKNQISDDKNLIEGQRTYNDKYKKQFEYAITIIELNDRSKMDTLGLIVRNLTQYSDFDRQGNIYETMVNSGDIKLLKNVAIINGIRELEQRYLYINRMETIHYDAMITYVVPSITPNIRFSNGVIENADSVYSFEFQNLIIALLKVMQEKEDVYSSAVKLIDEIVKLIDHELN